MQIAVFGPTGVLGQALIPLLLQSGHTLRAIARSAPKARVLFPEDVQVVECDLLAPEAEQRLRPALEGCEAAIHIATAIPRDFAVPNAWEANSRLRTDSVRMVLKVCLEVGTKRYLQQSITMAYSDQGQDWIDESVPLDSAPERALICAPVIAMESFVRATLPEKLQWSILRGGAFVGPGTHQEQTIRNMRAGKEIVPGDGANFVSFIHVADMASAFLAALHGGRAQSSIL